jgi:hypothetical protein
MVGHALGINPLVHNSGGAFPTYPAHQSQNHGRKHCLEFQFLLQTSDVIGLARRNQT